MRVNYKVLVVGLIVLIAGLFSEVKADLLPFNGQKRPQPAPANDPKQNGPDGQPDSKNAPIGDQQAPNRHPDVKDKSKQ